MAKKRNNKKYYKLKLILLILIIIIGIYILIKPKSYEITYDLNGIAITENYHKSAKTYTFTYQIEDYKFIMNIQHKYFHSKKLIDNITLSRNDTTICLIPESKKINTYILCNENGEYLDPELITDKSLIPETSKEIINPTPYENLNLYNLQDKKYLIWNYRGFYLLSKAQNQKINLFNEDIYSIPLATKVNKYLVIPNYEEKYNFNKFYVIDTSNGKVRDFNLTKTISSDSYILGINNNRLYLVDKKNEKEYELYPKRLIMDTISNNNRGKIIENGKWTSITLNKLTNSENKFTYDNITSYSLINNNLYEIVADYQTLLSKNVSKVITNIDNTVYYLKEDKLYSYNHYTGEVLIMQNFEWNFNNDNTIFIY